MSCQNISFQREISRVSRFEMKDLVFSLFFITACSCILLLLALRFSLSKWEHLPLLFYVEWKVAHKLSAQIFKYEIFSKLLLICFYFSSSSKHFVNGRCFPFYLLPEKKLWLIVYVRKWSYKTCLSGHFAQKIIL